MPAPSEAPASPSRPRSPPSTRFTPPTPTAVPAPPSPSPSTKRSKRSRPFPEYGQTPKTFAAESASNGALRNLFGRLVLPETLQAITQAPLQRRGGVGIESHEIPERLAAIPA